MVAYSFKERFAIPIQDGVKCQTIRAPRKRHVRPAEPLQLYVGMRTKSCRMIGVAQCLRISRVLIDLLNDRVDVRGGQLKNGRCLDNFAKTDGFQDWQDMRAFWRSEHPEVGQFCGWLIEWGDTFVRAFPDTRR